MSDEQNPYQSPETTSFQTAPAMPQGNLTETMLMYLKGASPWLRFIGIVGFIMAGLIALWGVVIFFIFLFSGGFLEDLAYETGGYFNYGGILGVVGGMTGVFTVGIAVLVFIPALFTYRFGDKIRKYLYSGTDRELEEAFKNNKSLWMFNGIIYIISLAFLPVTIIASVVIALAIYL